MDVLVTGGAGFIGANLCAALRADPDIGRIVVLDDLSTGIRENLEPLKDIELVVGSILDTEVLARSAAGIESIVHLAARPSVPRSLADPVATHNANATGTLNVLEAARLGSRPHVIVASSSSVYGANPALPKSEDMATMPMSPYGASKLATESYTLAHGRSFAMDVLAFRFFNVFGPLQAADHAYAAVIPAFIAAALRGEPVTVHGDGNQTRDFTYVGSVASVLVDAVNRRVSSDRPVNLAFGSRVSLIELIALLEKVTGVQITRNHTDPRPGDVRDSQADQSRLRQLFPDAVAVSLETGLDQTVGWFRTPTGPN
ncbi:MAG: NAD-dependent epimerase/dehydratase family protein [Acidimicrobiales bacterium]